MNKLLWVVVSKIQLCAYLCMFSAVAAAQGTGAIVESPAFTPGQASRQSAAAPASGNNDAMSLLLEQIQQLQTEVQALRGLIEEQGFELRKLQRDSLARYTNMDDRLSALESAPASNTAALTPGASTITPVIPTTTPNSLPANQPAVTTSAAGINAGATTGLAPTSSAAGLGTAIPERTAVTAAVTDNRISTLTPALPLPADAATDLPTNSPTNLPTTEQPELLLAAANTAAARNNSRGTLQPAVLSEQQLYQMAYDSVINSSFERSIAEFDQYLNIYPQGRFITNAHYWKGQAYLYLNRYEEARAAYEIIINQFADSPKLPDAMYGLGLSYQGLGDIDQARRLLNDIKRRFPNTGVANLADTRLLSLQ